MAEVQLLGPVELWTAGQASNLGPPKQRAVFAALVVDHGRPVSATTLLDRVWGDTPPPSARTLLHGYVSRIRRLFADVGEMEGRPLRLDLGPGGYRVDIGSDRVDLHRFRRLSQQGQQSNGLQDQERAALLRTALTLWQGDPLAGVPGTWADVVRQALSRRRLDTAIAWARAELRLGNGDEVIRELRDLVAAYPLAEPLAAALIRALHGSGRGAEALEFYDSVRHRLADELGVDPGGELRETYQTILRDGSGLPVSQATVRSSSGGSIIPAQLPLDSYGFVGREAELTRMDAILAAVADQPVAVMISAVSGTAGVGKTALAVHWAHQARHRFPDGQLYVNLRGYDDIGDVMTPGEALRGFLDALGVTAERIPESPHAQAGLYRSVLAGRRMLVVLDNARDAEQVRPLLPGDASVVTVVTSRSQLTGLVAMDGARPLTLDVLSAQQARALLVHRLGAGPTDADPVAVDQIIAACARLPLALTIAAARVQLTGFPLAAVAADLADAGRRLDALDTGDRAGQIRTVLSWSYAALTPPAARLFILLGMHPGPEISAAAAASLAGQPASDASRLLAELTRASMLIEPVHGRFAFHDLLREYAHEQARMRLTHRERDDAVRRVLEHYLHSAYAADRVINPCRDPIVLPTPAPDVVAESHLDRMAALAWFRTERAVLLAAVRCAADRGRHTTCWQLAWTLAVYLDRRGDWQDLATIGQVALAAVSERGDRLGRAHASCGLGRARGWLGHHDDARTHFRRALALFAELGDQIGQAVIHGHFGWLLERCDRHEEAYDNVLRALQCYQSAGFQPGVADALARSGFHAAKLGRPKEALDRLRRGLALQHEVGDRRGEAITYAMLGGIHHDLHELDHSVACYERAAELIRVVGERYYEGRCQAALGDTYHAIGRAAAARAAWQRALDILTDLHHPEADLVRAKLRRSGQ